MWLQWISSADIMSIDQMVNGIHFTSNLYSDFEIFRMYKNFEEIFKMLRAEKSSNNFWKVCCPHHWSVVICIWPSSKILWTLWMWIGCCGFRLWAAATRAERARAQRSRGPQRLCRKDVQLRQLKWEWIPFNGLCVIIRDNNLCKYMNVEWIVFICFYFLYVCYLNIVICK